MNCYLCTDNDSFDKKMSYRLRFNPLDTVLPSVNCNWLFIRARRARARVCVYVCMRMYACACVLENGLINICARIIEAYRSNCTLCMVYSDCWFSSAYFMGCACMCGARDILMCLFFVTSHPNFLVSL